MTGVRADRISSRHNFTVLTDPVFIVDVLSILVLLLTLTLRWIRQHIFPIVSFSVTGKLTMKEGGDSDILVLHGRQFGRLDEELKELGARRARLLLSHQERVRSVSIQVDPQYEMTHRGSGAFLSKTDILNILQRPAEEIPPCMLWQNRAKSGAMLRHNRHWNRDRDILLARFKLEGFEEEFIDQPYFVYTKYRGDEDFMTALVSKNPHALKIATSKLKASPKVVLAAVTHRSPFAPLCIQHAAAKVRGDKMVARTALAHPYGIRCAKFLTRKLQNDKRLILKGIRQSTEECNRYYELLSDLTDQLRADADIVSAAVQKNGTNIRWAAKELQTDYKIAYLACRQNGGALEFLPKSSSRKTLLSNSDTLRMILSNGGGPMLKYSPEPFQRNQEYVLLAIQNGLQDLGSLRLEMKIISSTFPNLLESMLSYNADLWEQLSVPDQNNPELAMICLSSNILSDHTVRHIFRKNPILLERPEAMNVVQGLLPMLCTCGSSAFYNDKSFMVKACEQNFESLELVGEELCDDMDVFLSAVSSCGALGVAYPKRYFDFDRQNGTILISNAIEAYECELDDMLALRNIFRRFPSIQENRDLMLVWLRKFKCVCVDDTRLHFPSSIFSDSELVLAFMEAGDRELYLVQRVQPWVTYHDENFWTRAIEVDGRSVGCCGWHPARGNKKLLTFAVGNDRRNLQSFSHSERDVLLLAKLSKELRKKLGTVEVFIMTFLRGMAIPNKRRVPPALRCHLPKLDGGEDIKRLIGEFVGIDFGKELKLLRSAVGNLEFWGY